MAKLEQIQRLLYIAELLKSKPNGITYEEAKGLNKDYKKAAEYYALAVEQGENEVLLDLARLYKTGGYGLAKNQELAEEYEAKWSDLQ